MSMGKIIILGVVFPLAGLLLTTYSALEYDGFVVIETLKSKGGQARHTHTWFVIEENKIFLEAGHPENPWVQDLQHLRHITVEGEGVTGRDQFSIHDLAPDHTRIRQMMRAKYGW